MSPSFKRVPIVIAVILSIAAASVPVARFIYPLRYEDLILEKAERYDIDPALIAAIIYEESKFDPRSQSSAGAVGLMQVMPETASWAAREIGRPELAGRLTEPTANLAVGTWYFRYLLDRYESAAFALAAYNGGRGNLDNWLAKSDGRAGDEIIETIPFAETRAFVRRTQRSRKIYGRLYPVLRRD